MLTSPIGSAAFAPKTPIVAVFVIGFVAVSVATVFWGPSRTFLPSTDGSQYLHLARSMAAGQGFKDADDLWPLSPDIDRMPGWPAIIAAGLKIAPWASPEAVDRFANALCLALAGMFFAVAVRYLGARPLIATLAGLAVALSPMLVYLSVDGMSEPSFVLLVALALACMLAGGRWIYLGAVAMGCAALVRSAALPVVPAAAVLALFAQKSRRWLIDPSNRPRCLLVAVLVALPPGLWLVRNYAVSGRFPLFSALEGEVLYGSNNEVVANDLYEWGYWIVPSRIPGEPPKPSWCNVFHSNAELNDYYHRKAMEWIRGHLSSMPRLELGKFVRAFVPVPWVPLLPSYLAFSGRFLLYVLAALLLPFWWRKTALPYVLLFAGMTLVHLWTTAVYYGCSRFTYCFFEVFLIPCIAVGAEQWISTRRGGGGALPAAAGA